MKLNLAKKSEPGLSSAELAERVIAASMDAKAREVVILDVAELFGLADNFIIMSGRSDRQVQGIANRILDSLGREGVKPTSIEGFESGHWILLDFDDVIVHIFYEQMREHYNVESLWTTAPRREIEETFQSRPEIRRGRVPVFAE